MQKIHSYRTPKDKMVVLVNFITVVAKSSEQLSKTPENNKEKPAEIDKFLPLVIYYLIKCQPSMLKSTVRFIKLFRNRERFTFSEGYYHTLIVSALDFIEKIGPDKIEMKPEDFESKYTYYGKLCEARIEEQLAIWRYAPILKEKNEKKKDDSAQEILKEIRKLSNKVKGFVNGIFEKLTIGQLKQITETQAQICKKIN